MHAALLALALAVSGFHGTVMRGPTKPVCIVGQPCSEPAVGATLLFSSFGAHVVARALVGAGGRYAVRIAPGYYVVTTPAAHPIGSGVRPRNVHVARGVYGRLDFAIDTGIR